MTNKITTIERDLQAYESGNKSWEVSLSDIINSKEYTELCPTHESCGQKELSQLLYTFGLDTNKKVETQNLKHRNWRGEIVTCLRWVGTMRTDPTWTKFIQSTNKYQNN